jgi:hypothetical protein
MTTSGSLTVRTIYPSRAWSAPPRSPRCTGEPSGTGSSIQRKASDDPGQAGGNQPGSPAEPSSFYQPKRDRCANGDIIIPGGTAGPIPSDQVQQRRQIHQEIGKGSAHGEFDQPHAGTGFKRSPLRGRSRNNRIQILDLDGKFLEEWFQFSRPSGIFIDKQDNIYVADSESGSVARTRTDWKRGIRIGRIRDGVVTAFIPDPTENPPSTSGAEGVSVDAAGNIYGAEVGQKLQNTSEIIFGCFVFLETWNQRYCPAGGGEPQHYQPAQNLQQRGVQGQRLKLEFPSTCSFDHPVPCRMRDDRGKYDSAHPFRYDETKPRAR